MKKGKGCIHENAQFVETDTLMLQMSLDLNPSNIK
jgi:hypothetical protein